MTLQQDDLFAPTAGLGAAHLLALFERWASGAPGKRGTLNDESVAVYRDMWVALVRWAEAKHIDLLAIRPNQLEAYLASRGGDSELDARYSWRLLRLVQRVLNFQALEQGGQPNHAVLDLLRTRPELRYANAAEQTRLPEFLDAGEARALVAFLATELRSGTWQDARNRAAVALHMGAGLTPAEVRSLTVTDVRGLRTGTRKIRVPANGTVAEHEAPIAPWAWNVVASWMATRSEATIGGEWLLPATRAGRPWGKSGHYLGVSQVLESVGLPPAGGAYRLRHTFALRQLKRGRSTSELAAWLGVDEQAVARYRMVISGPVDVV